MSQCWLVTGASSGLGASIVLAALRAGHKAVGTARNVSKAQADYPDIEKQGGKWITLDVTKSDAESVVSKAVQENNVTCLVNNAGYAVKGPLEELTFDRIRAQWETNYFGLLACSKGAIPHFRARKSGCIVQISSIAAIRGVGGYSEYCGTKFAVKGMSEALAGELAPFNIRILIAQLGSFRTNFQTAASGTNASSAYAGTPADEMPKLIASTHGKQPGDPDKAAEAIVEVVSRTGRGSDAGVGTALRMPLGKDAVQVAYTKLDEFRKDVDSMKHISEWAVYPES